MDTKNSIVLGNHKGINLIQKEDGTQMYYSTKTGKCAMSLRGVARMLGCNAQSISNQAVKQNIGKNLEMYTDKGVQSVKLIMEDELNSLFSVMLKSKVKQTTKDKIVDVQSKYVQAGFRLQVLLEIAPEVVAKEAIGRITDPGKAKEVAACAQTHSEYLETFWTLGDAIQATGASFGAIHGHNNKLAGIENGNRPLATDDQKGMLTLVQIAEKRKLEANKERYKNGHHATNSAKKAGTQIAEAMAAIEAGSFKLIKN